MKLKSIFKKSTKVVAKSNVEKLEKKQLEKVIGGTEGEPHKIPGFDLPEKQGTH